jgi:hypothetical protein
VNRDFLKDAGVEVPLAILALAFFIALVFQTVELVRQSQTLATISVSQATPLQEATHLREATEALARDITKLADSGNADAKQVVDEMAKQHIALVPRPAPKPETH